MGTTTLTRSLLTDVSLFGVITDALGTAVANVGTYDDNEVGKGVIMAAASYVAASKDDEIEGIVNSISPNTVNTGFSWGGIQTKGRFVAILGASQDTAAAVGDAVVNDTPIPDGTAGVIQVYGVGSTGFPAGPFLFNWRIIRLIDGGDTGDQVLIERI